MGSDGSTEALHISYDVPAREGVRYKCLLCGRCKFTRPSPHKCVGGYRKRKIKWEVIETLEQGESVPQIRTSGHVRTQLDIKGELNHDRA